ncbi:MAG: hypothetical protein KA354_02900 [Phycisphaerae bacterium]|nr:hypothetical protein [Phycisphaerae bacterium]
MGDRCEEAPHPLVVHCFNLERYGRTARSGGSAAQVGVDAAVFAGGPGWITVLRLVYSFAVRAISCTTVLSPVIASPQRWRAVGVYLMAF